MFNLKCDCVNLRHTESIEVEKMLLLQRNSIGLFQFRLGMMSLMCKALLRPNFKPTLAPGPLKAKQSKLCSEGRNRQVL